MRCRWVQLYRRDLFDKPMDQTIGHTRSSLNFYCATGRACFRAIVRLPATYKAFWILHSFDGHLKTNARTQSAWIASYGGMHVKKFHPCCTECGCIVLIWKIQFQSSDVITLSRLHQDRQLTFEFAHATAKLKKSFYCVLHVIIMTDTKQPLLVTHRGQTAELLEAVLGGWTAALSRCYSRQSFKPQCFKQTTKPQPQVGCVSLSPRTAGGGGRNNDINGRTAVSLEDCFEWLNSVLYFAVDDSSAVIPPLDGFMFVHRRVVCNEKNRPGSKNRVRVRVQGRSPRIAVGGHS